MKNGSDEKISGESNMGIINNRCMRLQLIPLKYYAKKFFFEKDYFKNNFSQYNVSQFYPTMYKTDKYGLSKRILGKKKYFDIFGIPMVHYENNEFYNPVMIAQYGLMNYGFYLHSKNRKYLDLALLAGEWLLNNCNQGRIEYKFNYMMKCPETVISAPFISAMSQGQAISLWSRLYLITNDKRWLLHIREVSQVIVSPICAGGTSSQYNNNIWYEEYPSVPGTHVLNGFLFCLIGLYDGFQVTKDNNLETAFKQGIESLRKMLPLFDNGYISYYHLGHLEYTCQNVLISPSYHIIHVLLLETLFSITQIKEFEFYIKKWKR